MKIVNIIGGLGNQLFQCAFAIALKEEFPDEEIKVNISCFRGYPLHNGFEIEDIFPDLNITHASTKDLMKVAWPWTHYKLWQIGSRILPQRSSMTIDTNYKEDFSFDMIKNKSYFDGYWQSPKFFEKHKDKIVEAFKFPHISDINNLEILNKIKTQPSAFIHVRRGDYINHPIFGGICTLDYYLNGIEILRKKYEFQQFLIFSNDINWCKENLTKPLAGASVIFVDWNKGSNSHFDIQLMSKCAGGIVANSSFSWWGAWLSSSNKIICPFQWTNDPNINSEIIPDSWIRCDNNHMNNI